MKTTFNPLNFLLSALLLVSLKSNAQHQFSFTKNSTDSLVCLEISGELDRDFKKQAGTYTVVLIHFNTPVDTAVIKDSKSFQFKLQKDSYYALKVYKKGFAPKLVSICTTMPEEVFTGKLLRFHFEAELIPENEFEQLNPEVKDFPIAIVRFDESKKIFYYNEKYTRNIKKSLYIKKNALLF